MIHVECQLVREPPLPADTALAADDGFEVVTLFN